MDATPKTTKGQRLDILVALVEAYERKHYILDLPDPVEAIKFRMEQMGLSPKDLEPIIGRRNRVYEVLNRKRPLTMKMAWRLHCELGIPVTTCVLFRPIPAHDPAVEAIGRSFRAFMTHMAYRSCHYDASTRFSSGVILPATENIIFKIKGI